MRQIPLWAAGPEPAGGTQPRTPASPAGQGPSGGTRGLGGLKRDRGVSCCGAGSRRWLFSSAGLSWVRPFLCPVPGGSGSKVDHLQGRVAEASLQPHEAGGDPEGRTGPCFRVSVRTVKAGGTELQTKRAENTPCKCADLLDLN